MLRFNFHSRSTTRARFGLGLGCMLGLALPGFFIASANAQAPGPESFAKPPTTSLELWDAADYLVRTGQSKIAVSYLNSFLKTNPSDDVLIKIHDDYGLAAILRLDDHAETKPLARPILEKVGAAIRKRATDPDRLARAIDQLVKSPAEQSYAVDRLREAGASAIPPLVKRLAEPDLPHHTRALIVANMGRLDTKAQPALIAALGAPNRTVGADAATVLGLMDDARAVPFLTYPATAADSAGLKEAARLAIQRITGKSLELQPKSPIRFLTDEAWKYHRHQVAFKSDPVEVWLWNEEAQAPAPLVVPKSVAESIYGGRLAREALLLDKSDLSAQVVFLSFLLEKPVERDGVGSVARDSNPAFAQALAMGPVPLTKVMQTAIKDGHYDLAAIAALALGRVADRDVSGLPEAVGPLVQALATPDRRVQYAAATALVDLNPSKPFVGSSRVVPVLARFLTNRAPKALIVDGNLNRANTVAATMKQIGYDIAVAGSGKEGFREAAVSTDVEIILLDPTVLQGAWTANDTLTNLRADSRTAGIPIFLYGPLPLRDRLGGLLTNFPRVDFVVTPLDPTVTRDLIGRRLDAMGTKSLSAAERTGFAQGAASYLATIATRPNGPFAANLPQIEPDLARALDNPAAADSAAIVLGDVPGEDAQRSLARIALDPGRPAAFRFTAARSLARNIQKFGPLLSTDHEKRLVVILDEETDPAIKGALSSVYGALRPSAEVAGGRLQSYKATQAARVTPPPSPTSEKPTPTPAPPAEGNTKPDEPADKPEGKP